MAPPADDARTTRPLPWSIAVGVGVGIGAAAIAFFLIAIPFYTLASFEPNGLDRPIVRTGLFRIALPVGALIGLAVGIAVARWARRGGAWRLDDGGDRYSTR
jgi:hypothetical protein